MHGVESAASKLPGWAVDAVIIFLAAQLPDIDLAEAVLVRGDRQ